MAKKLVIFVISWVCLFTLIGSKNLLAETFKLNSISVEGNKRLSSNAISNYLNLNLTDTLSDSDLDKAYKNIVNTNLFRLVEFKRRGGTLNIVVEEYPTVNKISFEGNTKITDKKLESLLTIKPRIVLTPMALKRDVEALSAKYKNFGRVSARIDPKVIKLSDNRVNVVFEIFEGSVTEIERISFVGNRAFSDRRLRRVVESKQAGPLRKLISRDILINERISFDKKLLSDFYLSRGYFDFEIYNVSVELSEEKDGFFISYNIKEGPKFDLGEIIINSNVIDVSAEKFRPFIDLKSGHVYSALAVQTAISKLEEHLKKEGHEFVGVQSEATRNLNELSIDLQLTFVKKPKLFVDRIDITGNTATFDRVLRRQFRFVEGDPFSLSEMRNAETRIRALGLFSDVKIKARPSKSQSRVIVDVRVREMPTGSLTFGAGYSSASGLGGIVEYAEKNFLGRGQKLSFGIKSGKDDQLYELSFYEPMFLRNDLGFGFDVSLKDNNKLNAAYDSSILKLEPYFEFAIGDKSKLKVDYFFEETDLGNPGNVGSVISGEINSGKYSVSGLGYAFKHDTRLYKSGPENGALFQIEQKFLGLGGDKSGIKSSVKVAVQREALKEELKLTATFEGGNLSLDKGNSSVVDRFSLGPSKMRGFKPGGIGPRECSDIQCTTAINDALGGENYAVVRLEAQFPLGLPEEYGISAGLFYDVGNLWSLSENSDNVLYEEGSWRQSVGASIFWKTPIGPLRFNFTDAISKELYDLDEAFDLTISTRF